MKLNINKNKPTILYVSFWPWFGLHSGPQHLAINFAERYNVIYSSPIPYGFSKNKIKHLINSSRLNKKVISKEMSSLEFNFLPTWKFNFIRKLNHKLWAKSIINYLNKNKIEIDILWLNSPEQLPFVTNLKFKILTYHCLDDYDYFYNQIKYIEPIVFKKSDLIIVTAQLLAEKALKHSNSKNIHLIPNGVELEHFRKVLHNKFVIPEDIANLKKPLIGYVGTIADWMDFDILEELHNELEATIVLVGPVESKKAILMQKEGKIVLLNKKPYKDLPNYLHYFNVCIIPFVDNYLTRAVDPNKIYEYFAAGKEVVSTPLPPLKRFSKYISLESDPIKFTLAVKKILDNPTSVEKSKMLSLEMENHSWKARAEKIMDIFKENL